MKILLVNPWIYDFAAYDLWMAPWGLLKISSILKKSGAEVYLVDALDRHHYLLDAASRDRFDGTGKFHSEEVDKPEALLTVPRKYKRYGLPVDMFKAALPEEDIGIILVSSGMTYWYPGVFMAIDILRERYPKARIILGGVYATLCHEHAAALSGADLVIGNRDIQGIDKELRMDLDLSFRNILDAQVDYSFYNNPSYAVLRLSLGCPFNCSYCAQKMLAPDPMFKDPVKAMEELVALYGRGIRNFAFYDDALLFDREYIVRYMSEVRSRGIKARFFTPNGLHARFLNKEVARGMKATGFINPVLSLETTRDDEALQWHSKVTRDDVGNAIGYLKEAGYQAGEYTVYLMIGLPGSRLDGIEESIEFINSLGARVSLSEFSPVPGTYMSEGLDPDISREPLLQNNSIFPMIPSSKIAQLNKIKELATRLNLVLVPHIHNKTM